MIEVEHVAAQLELKGRLDHLRAAQRRTASESNRLPATQPTPTVRSLSLPISIADLGWVVSTGVVVLTGLVPTAGAIVLVAVAAVVLELAVTQLVRRR